MQLVNELNANAIKAITVQLNGLNTRLTNSINDHTSIGQLNALLSKIEALQQELVVRVWLNDINQQPAKA